MEAPIAFDDTRSDSTGALMLHEGEGSRLKHSRLFVQCYLDLDISERAPAIVNISSGPSLVTQPSYYGMVCVIAEPQSGSWTCARAAMPRSTVVYTLDPVDEPMQYEEALEAISVPSEEAMTIASWTLYGQAPEREYEEIVAETTAEIARLLSGLAQRSPLRRSAGLRRLAETVAHGLERPESADIESWARRLSQDIADATD